MVLSIGMIVKNEEKYLEQCLTALQPILNELDSELIIADTGSTDRTVEIAKKFTDNVFHFDWINDFSAARNSTLEKAKGDWYMFVDADEIAVDCKDIIKFFKSGEHKKYKSASYIQRSYVDESDLADTVDFRVLRVVKREANTKFINPIHEFLSPFYRPSKYLDFVVMHYGYMYAGANGQTELAREKSKRNLELLFDDLDKSTKLGKIRPNIYNQIADCYDTVEDYENTFKYLDMGLEALDHHSIDVVPYYSHKVFVLSKLDRLDEVIEVSDEYFDLKANPFHTKELASDCYIRAMRGYAYYKRHEYGNAIDEIVKFIDLYTKYTKGKLNTEDLVMEVWRTTETIVKACFDIFFRCCHQEGRYELANKYTDVIPLEKYFGDQSFLVNHINIRIMMMEQVGFDDLDKLYKQLDDFGKDYLLTMVRRRVFLASPEYRTVIIKKLAELGGLPAEVAEIYKGYFEDNAPDFKLIGKFLKKHGSENSEDMLYILIENQEDITPFLLTEDFFADRAVQILARFFPNGIELYQNYDIENISQDGLLRATSLYGWIMRRLMEMRREISGLFESYGTLGMKWNEIFGGSEALPGDIHAALLVNDVVSAKKSGNKTRFMEEIRKLKAVVPDLIPLADAYKEENKDSFKATRVNPEFEQLAVQVKRNIRELIAAGNIGDARKLIKEFEEISPNDSDIETLKDEINNSLQ